MSPAISIRVAPYQEGFGRRTSGSCCTTVDHFENDERFPVPNQPATDGPRMVDWYLLQGSTEQGPKEGVIRAGLRVPLCGDVLLDWRGQKSTPSLEVQQR